MHKIWYKNKVFAFGQTFVSLWCLMTATTIVEKKRKGEIICQH